MRNKRTFSVLLAVLLPLLMVGPVLYTLISQPLIDEKRHQLFGIAQLAEKQLVTDYKEILRRQQADKADAPRQVKTLQKALESNVDLVARGYPGVGVGYYSLQHDVVVAYAPLDDYGSYVGRPVADESVLRKVMDQGAPEFAFERGLKGDIMIAVQPVIRGQEIIGCVFADESAAQFTATLNSIKWEIGVALAAAYLAIIALLLLAGRLLAGRVDDHEEEKIKERMTE